MGLCEGVGTWVSSGRAVTITVVTTIEIGSVTTLDEERLAEGAEEVGAVAVPCLP